MIWRPSFIVYVFTTLPSASFSSTSLLAACSSVFYSVSYEAVVAFLGTAVENGRLLPLLELPRLDLLARLADLLINLLRVLRLLLHAEHKLSYPILQLV